MPRNVLVTPDLAVNMTAIPASGHPLHLLSGPPGNSSSDLTEGSPAPPRSGPQVHMLPFVLGYVAVLCFVVQAIPQLWLNYRRQSVQGFSTSSIVVRLAGASFHTFSAIRQQAAAPIQWYGLSQILINQSFIWQISRYSGNRWVLQWLLFPLIPWVCLNYFVFLVELSMIIKPVTQITSLVPQLVTCWKQRSASGVSMHSMHCSFVGGMAGLWMCGILEHTSPLVYIVYGNSVLQSVSMYVLCWKFDGIQFLIHGPPTECSSGGAASRWKREVGASAVYSALPSVCAKPKAACASGIVSSPGTRSPSPSSSASLRSPSPRRSSADILNLQKAL